MPTLFDPIKIGSLSLKNRIIMAPLTRCRASDGRIPNEMMARYYAQRASAGLIISEATSVDPMGVGYPSTPGIWNSEQIQGWSKITTAVHNKDGKIFCQLWHVGRVSDPSYLDGRLPIAPSAIAPSGEVKLLRPKRPFVTPRALDLSEIAAIVETYRRAAQNALKAGFDGIELHGANGYLLDQFLQDSSNQRNDRYGGTLENRTRFMLEVTDACIEVWGAERVGMHLAPRADAHSMGDSNPLVTFSYVARELGKRNIAFICSRESLTEPRLGPLLKKEFGGTYIANEGLDFESGSKLLQIGEADAVAYGKWFISNPDLPEKFKRGTPLTPYDLDTFYFGGERGYTDYSFE